MPTMISSTGMGTMTRFVIWPCMRECLFYCYQELVCLLHHACGPGCCMEAEISDNPVFADLATTYKVIIMVVFTDMSTAL